MLNLDVTPAKMSCDEIKSWLTQCAAEISKAYDDDDIVYANKLDTIYQVVKQMGEEKCKNESFRGYLSSSMLTESVTEESSNPTYLIEVDEAIISFEDKLKDCDIELDAKVTVDDDLNIIDFPPITVDIGFKLPYIDEQQHIVLTYTPNGMPENLNIDNIPAKDYTTSHTDTGTVVSFKSLGNLADNLEEFEFTETIEWPFEMDFKSATVKKKFDKIKTLSGKIIALLGKDQLINKVSGYQSTHSSGSNKATRAKREAEALKATIRARGPFKSRTEILKDTLSAIPGITSIEQLPVMGNQQYYTKFRITFKGGWFDVFNGGMNFRVMDSLGGFGNNQEFRTDPSDPDASVTKTRNKVVAYIQKRMEDMKIAALSPRERAALAAKNKPKQRDLMTEYNEFIEMATNTLNGSNPVSRSVLSDKYDHLMYSERFLTDEQMSKVMELVTELDL